MGRNSVHGGVEISMSIVPFECASEQVANGVVVHGYLR